ncbi:protein-glutamine gamma-glutamyltransferase 2-like [Anguilla anguilla]|uniref:protein-glutamine gamma-glutamyltransferase 2-like n=1 Tax=Anguilla anguilla TaxID=7936 RepID=UPI0015A7AA25|nr:protein-glutamine gamma-glutamyltransferase 2-like [Anguilla anguilla]
MTSDLSKVDLLCEKNNEAHKTKKMSTERLIIRRGQTFLLTLHSSSARSLKPDSLELTVQTGPKPSEDLGTKCVFGVSRKSLANKSWDAKVQETSATSVTLAITSPADASIGEYTLSVTTNPNMTVSHRAGAFVLLFNPWCEEDWVHLADEKERQEYVMNEHGLIFRGASDYIHELAWDFGQFEADILDICLKMLDLNPKCKKNAAEDFSARCNPIYVSRVVSAMINSNDDRGVLEGNWSNSFWGGVSPSHWNGSVDILRTWKESDYHPVKYGQCWVFGGVMCTVLRCLGIPCRVVTNFLSAHDTHGNLLIDEYYSDHGVQPKESEDSIWNYHVWVEGWMRRPDLPGKPLYDGWQVLDPTPQELSEGVHCCGPAAVKAILEGHTELKYDLPFVFAEVNADRVTWLIMADGSQKRIMTETKLVGQNISTKSVGSDKRLDITANYKYPEGTEKEREAFREAVRRSEKLSEPEPAPEPPPPKISVKIEEQSKPINGTDIDLVIRLQSPTLRDLVLNVNAQVMLYNGVLKSDICSEEKEVRVLPDKELTVPFRIPFSKYGSHIQGNNSIKVTAVAKDKQHTEVVYLAEKNIVPENPPISITVTGDPVQFRDLQAEVRFDNPLPVALTNCSITITASGLLSKSVVSRLASLGPDLRVRVLVPFTPYRAGTKKMVADFDSDQFRDIKTSCNINIKPFLGA